MLDVRAGGMKVHLVPSASVVLCAWQAHGFLNLCMASRLTYLRIRDCSEAWLCENQPNKPRPKQLPRLRLPCTDHWLWLAAGCARLQLAGLYHLHDHRQQLGCCTAAGCCCCSWLLCVGCGCSGWGCEGAAGCSQDRHWHGCEPLAYVCYSLGLSTCKAPQTRQGKHNGSQASNRNASRKPSLAAC